MVNTHDENTYTTSDSWRTSKDVVPRLENSKVLWPKMTFGIFMLSYAGVIFLFIAMATLFILAVYLDTHGYTTAGEWAGRGAFVCVAATFCWVWYFFNDKGGY